MVRDEGALQVFYLSLALIIMGVGFLKPNISTIVGKLTPRTIRGAIRVHAVLCGHQRRRTVRRPDLRLPRRDLWWKYGFGAAGVGMLAGLAMFLWGQKYLHGHAEPRDPARLRERVAGLPREWWIYLGAFAGVVAVWRLIQGTALVAWAMHVVAALFLGWFAWFIARCDRVQRQQMIALLVLILGVLVFFTLYEQTYGSWLMFTDRLMTKDMFPSLVSDASGTLPWSIWLMAASPVLIVLALRASDAGTRGCRAHARRDLGGRDGVGVLPRCGAGAADAGSLTFLGSFFIVLLSPFFAWLWPWLEARGANPSKPAKSAIGLLFAALSFIPLLVAARTVGPGAMASVWWLVLAYFLLEIGEMCLSPIGLSAVTQLSVAQVVGVMMGGFWLATAYSELLAAKFGKLASIEVPEGGALNVVEASGTYGHLFQMMLVIGLGTAVVFAVLTPLLRRWMHGVK
jgi:POT family proton-dependent oligopeptide transporter